MKGRNLAMAALSGAATEEKPSALFTWGFDYSFQPAGLEPWRLALGGCATWHRAAVASFERHRPDIVWYNGAGSGPKEPTLVSENPSAWIVRDNNQNINYEIIKESLSVRECDTGKKGCDEVGLIQSKTDADRLVPLFRGWGENYLNGLKRLINELGDKALVLPHHSPAYICACYAFGFEKAMELLLTDPELFLYVCDRYREGDRLRMKEWAKAGAEACFIADGWASCDIISREMFVKFACPYQKAIIEAAHDAGLKVILWNEGNILPILDLEAALDVDAFAFEQARKEINIRVDKVREVFGPGRCIFGNLDSELLLMRNDPREITDAVHDQIRQSGVNEPFVVSTGSPIPSGTRPEAVDAMIKAARDFKSH